MTSDRDVRTLRSGSRCAVVVTNETLHIPSAIEAYMSSGSDSALKREMHAAMSDGCSSPSIRWNVPAQLQNVGCCCNRLYSSLDVYFNSHRHIHLDHFCDRLGDPA